MLSDPLKSLRLWRSFRKSVSIYPGSTPNLTDSVDIIGCYFGAPCDNTQYSVFYEELDVFMIDIDTDNSCIGD